MYCVQSNLFGSGHVRTRHYVHRVESVCLSEVKCVLAPPEVHLVLQCVLCREVISTMSFIQTVL